MFGMVRKSWRGGVPVLLAGMLSACGGDDPATQAQRQEEPFAVRPDMQPVMGPERHILAFGDSLFAGYNIRQEESYPARLEVALRARGINARIANAGVSGDTTAAGLQRLAFTLDSQPVKPDLVILELGGNDLLRGLPVKQTRDNLVAMLDELARRDIPVLLMGMRAPPNLGTGHVTAFDAVYPALAREYGVPFVPFFMEVIHDKPELLQPDRIHPTPQGVEELVDHTRDRVAAAIPPAK